MVVFLLASTPSTKSEPLTESKKFLTKVQFVISFGQTLMIDVDGAFLQEVLDTHLDKTSLSSSTMQTIWN